ncbi:MAG: hypothetical protein WKF76_05750 [Nocardioidaceae bacterium]
MRLRTRDTTALAAGSVATGLLAYVFFATATRALGPVAAAPVTVLWTYWSLAAAAFTFPVQHWIARTATAYDESMVRRALPGSVLWSPQPRPLSACSHGLRVTCSSATIRPSLPC